MQKFVEFPIEEWEKRLDPFAFFGQGAIAYAKTNDKENGLTISWGSLGMLWRKRVVTVYVHATRYSKGIFDNANTFSVMSFGGGYQKELAYFGSKSGAVTNKAKDCSFHVAYDEDAPYFEEAEIVIIAKKIGQSDFDKNHVDAGVKSWYESSGVHTIYQGEIVKVLKKVK